MLLQRNSLAGSQQCCASLLTQQSSLAACTRPARRGCLKAAAAAVAPRHTEDTAPAAADPSSKRQQQSNTPPQPAKAEAADSGGPSSSSSSSSSVRDVVLERACAAAAADASQACLAEAASLKVDGLKLPALKPRDKTHVQYQGCTVPEHRRMEELQAVAEALTRRTAAGQHTLLQRLQPEQSAGQHTLLQRLPPTQPQASGAGQKAKQRQQRQQQTQKQKQRQVMLLEELQRQQQERRWLQWRAALQARASLPSDVRLADCNRLALQWRRQLANVLLQQQLRQLLQGRQQQAQQQQAQQQQEQQQQEQQEQHQAQQEQQGQSHDSAQQQLPRKWQGPKHRSPAMLKARQSAAQNSTQQQSTTQDSTAQDSTAEDSTAQDSTEQQSAAEESTAQDSTEQQSAAEESTAHDSTEQDSTAEDSAEQESTAEESTGQGDEAPDLARPQAQARAAFGYFSQPVSFLGRAASPGVLLNSLDRHLDVLSAEQCSQAYARLAGLCRGSPKLLQHQYTQQLLCALQAELPRLQQQLQPRHLAMIAAAGIQLQQPQLLRRTLLQLLQHPKARHPARLLDAVVACAHMQEMGLARVLLRVLLSDDSMLAPLPDVSKTAARLAKPAGKQLPTQQQLALLSTLLQAVDTSSVQQLALGLWVASCILPDCQSAAWSMLDQFVWQRSQATPLAVVLVLSCVAALHLQPPPFRGVRKLLLTAEQQLLEISGHMLAPRLVSSTLLAAARTGFMLSAEQVQTFVDAFCEQLSTATATQICDVCWAVARSGQRLRYAQLRPLLARFVQLLPAAGAGHVKTFLVSVAAMKLSLPQDQGQQLVAAVLDKVPARKLVAAADLCRQVMHAAAAVGLLLPAEQLRQFEAVWLQLWPRANDEQCRAVFNALSVFAQLNYCPTEVCKLIVRDRQQLQKRLDAASMNSLYDAAGAFAIFPATGRKWLRLRVAHAAAARLEAEGVAAAGVAVATSVCWALAVGDLRGSDLVRCVRHVAAECSGVWETVGLLERQKLLYVHTWLEQKHPWYLGDQSDGPTGPGLAGALTEQQLADCRAAWAGHRHRGGGPTVSMLQQQIFDLLLQLPADTWEQQGGPVLEQLTDDGVFSIDIAATRADSVRLAIEVDGPRHFMLPGNDLNGPTRSRNMLLEGRGFRVVSIPYFDWQALPADQQLDYLLRTVQLA